MTFKALRKMKPQAGAELVELELPAELGPKEVLIEIEVAAICASDVHVYAWRPEVAALKIPLPFTMGHEFCGKVVQVGPQVETLVPGDRVSGETHWACGHCYYCQTGDLHICANMRLVGRTLDGCFGEYATLPEINARKIPATIPPEKAALLEPLGVAVHALEAAEVSGKNVAILGCGAIGLLAIGAAKALGALSVFATSRSAGKLERAREMGADLVLNAAEDDVVGEMLKATGGLGVDAVIELSGSEEALHQGFQVLRKGGVIVLVGLPPEPVKLDIPGEMIRKEARLVGSFGRRMWQTWMTTERLLERGLVDVALATGRSFPLAQYQEAFREAASPAPGRVLLMP